MASLDLTESSSASSSVWKDRREKAGSQRQSNAKREGGEGTNDLPLDVRIGRRSSGLSESKKLLEVVSLGTKVGLQRKRKGKCQDSKKREDEEKSRGLTIRWSTGTPAAAEASVAALT